MVDNERRAEHVKNVDVRRGRKITKGGGTGGVWLLGFIGTLVYYLHFHSGTFWLVLTAVFKAVFWPAYLVYHLLVFLHP